MGKPKLNNVQLCIHSSTGWRDALDSLVREVGAKLMLRTVERWASDNAHTAAALGAGRGGARRGFGASGVAPHNSRAGRGSAARLRGRSAAGLRAQVSGAAPGCVSAAPSTASLASLASCQPPARALLIGFVGGACMGCDERVCLCSRIDSPAKNCSYRVSYVQYIIHILVKKWHRWRYWTIRVAYPQVQFL
jgi:hypothetical protein